MKKTKHYNEKSIHYEGRAISCEENPLTPISMEVNEEETAK